MKNCDSKNSRNSPKEIKINSKWKKKKKNHNQLKEKYQVKNIA